MNEAETRAERIDPKLKACGWGVVEGSKVLREYHLVTNCSRFEKIRQALEGRAIGSKKEITARSSRGAKYQQGI